MTSHRKLFVNLPVRDLARSIEFFTALGFTFNKQFTDEKATCMIVSEEAYFMLLVEPFFKSFMEKEICDTKTHTEALLSLTCTSREEVDEMVKKAVAAGGAPAMEPTDQGFMYSWGFYDLDRHSWGVFWMDPKAVQPQK